MKAESPAAHDCLPLLCLFIDMSYELRLILFRFMGFTREKLLQQLTIL